MGDDVGVGAVGVGVLVEADDARVGEGGLGRDLRDVVGVEGRGASRGDGMDVVDRIAATPTNRWNGDRPYEDQVMETVRVVEE